MNLNDEQSSDLFNLLCGRMIGEGQYRKVFECHVLPGCVVKQDTRANFSNISEWELWTECEKSPLAKWLAPVLWLSPAGLWLIQKRTSPLTVRDLPARVPAIFADHKPENWGMLDGRPVCHDYGNHGAYRIARRSKALIRASWRS